MMPAISPIAIIFVVVFVIVQNQDDWELCCVSTNLSYSELKYSTF